MNKQNKGNQVFFCIIIIYFPWQGCGAGRKGGHFLAVLAEPAACFALMQGCGAGIGWWGGGRERKQSKPEKNPSELLSSPFSVNGRDTRLWELQWGMGPGGGGEKPSKALQSAAALVLLSFQP